MSTTWPQDYCPLEKDNNNLDKLEVHLKEKMGEGMD